MPQSPRKIARVRPAGTVEAPGWDLPGPARDPLLASLVLALRANGADRAPEALTSGIPLPPDGRLTPSLALRALEAQGFAATLSQRPLNRIPDEVLPAILFLNGRDACVFEGRTEDGSCLIRRPAQGEDQQQVTAEDLAGNYAGSVLLLREDPSHAATEATPRPSGHWFWGIVGQYSPQYAQVILASALINILALATPLFTMNVYDRVFPNASLITLWSLVAGVGVALLFDALLKLLRASVVDAVWRRVDLKISAGIFRHIADLRLEAQRMSSGALMNSLKDFEQVRDFFSSQTVAALTDLAFAGLFIAVIAYIGGPLAWPPLLALSGVILIGLFVLIPLRRAANDARQMTGVKNAVAVEAITDLETLKAISGQGKMQARWETQVAAASRAQERTRRWANLATTISASAQQLSSVGIVIIGVYLALEGRLTMGAVIAAMILSGRAMAPTAALTGLFVRGSFAISTLRALDQIMDLPVESKVIGGKIGARPENGAFSLNDIRLTYPDAPAPALDDLNIEIASGERIGIIGPVGAGKTSLVRLLAGLYHPEDGTVLLDGLNVRQLDPATVRGVVQLVPQDAVLFSGSLAENIAFGQAGVSDARILAAARAAGVDALAARHPQGFGMPVAERGKNLSGGQRQMVALARALVSRPKVLLLDEPTSSMDMQTEKAFIGRLAALMQSSDMTLVISTHRMGLLDLVDRLVMLDRGKLRADGPKAEVLKRLKVPGAEGKT